MNDAVKSLADLCGRILAEMWIAEQKLKAEQKASDRGGEAAAEPAGEGETTKDNEKNQ